MDTIEKEHEQPKPEGHGGLIVIVAPSGATLDVDYKPNEKVGVVLHHAVIEFGKAGQVNPTGEYILTLGATALDNSLSLEHAGVNPGNHLNLRSKEIPGDGYASGAL